MSEQQPILYIVATPIGTLADLSPRARQTLENVDFIACEDTRKTRELLSALKLSHGPLVSLHEHNEREKSSSLVEKLKSSQNKTAALVSDAGTPAISDPGALLVDACHMEGIRIESIPGPSSLVAALAATGFLRPRIVFVGFLPRNRNDQIDEFKKWTYLAPCIAICFESPHRVVNTLKNAMEFFPGSVSACVSREISKKFEEHIRGPLTEIVSRLDAVDTIKGECVVSFDLSGDLQAKDETRAVSFEEVVKNARQMLSENPVLKTKTVVKELADRHNLNAKELYNAVVGNRDQ